MRSHGPYNLTLRDRLDRMSEWHGECLEWIGTKNQKGYGRIKVAGRMLSAHRVVWEMRNGPVPTGLEIDHTCGNRGCIEVLHLRVVTHLENVRSKHAPPRTHCKYGHEFTPDNTRYDRHGSRSCRACRRRDSLARHRRLRVVPAWRAERRTCDQCESIFSPAMPWAQFCSPRCKSEARVARRRNDRHQAKASSLRAR